MDLVLPRPHLLIAEARERQRRRRLRLVRALAALAVLATAGYALSERLGSPAVAAEQVALPNACALLTNADVEKVFGAKVAYRSYEQYGGCTWLGRPFERQYGQQTMTLGIAHATRADFDRLSTFVVSDGPGLRRVARSTPIQGVGNAAFAQIFAARDLEVFYGGLVISIKTTFVSSQLRAEKRLAQAAVERIRAVEART